MKVVKAVHFDLGYALFSYYEAIINVQGGLSIEPSNPNARTETQLNGKNIKNSKR